MRFTAFLLIAGILATAAEAETVVLQPVADNTIYEEDGTVSNGAGAALFAGRTAGSLGTLSRRALLKFNVADSVPAGSVITSATLRMNVSRTRFGSPSANFSLYRVAADWGEGTSSVGFNEGQGAPATPNDATWTHRFYGSVSWANAGGDYSAAGSATSLIAGIGSYQWGSTAQLIADVQGWLDDPATAFGWLVRVDNESVLSTAKQFDSKDHATAAVRPQLAIEYTPPPPDPLEKLLTYTRLAQPCRVIDTRIAGGSLQNGTPRHFRVSGTTGFFTQGGTEEGCEVPAGEATAAVVNFVAVNPASAGNLRGSAYPAPVPAAGSIINYQALTPPLNVANGLAVPLCDDGEADCSAADITLQANGGATDLVADVLGYFTPLPASEISSLVTSVRVSTGSVSFPCSTLTAISVNAPESGRVVVRGVVVLSVAHVAGVTDTAAASVSTTLGSCDDDGAVGEAGRSWIDQSLPAGTYISPMTIRRTFMVAPGAHTFFVNARILSGSAPQPVHNAGIDAVFYPD